MRIDINFTSASSSSSSSLSFSSSHSSVSSKQPPLNAQQRRYALPDILGNAKLSAKNDSGLKTETDKKDLNSGTYWFPADTSSVSFEIDETTEIGKRIIEAIYETSAKYSSKLTISPPDKGFKSKLDTEREELEKTEKSFNSGAFVRKDDRPNVITIYLMLKTQKEPPGIICSYRQTPRLLFQETKIVDILVCLSIPFTKTH